MIKKNFKRKKVLERLLFITLLACMVYACMEENRMLWKEDLPPKISEARMWYNSKLGDGFIPFNPLSGGYYELTPDWNKSFSNEDTEYKVTEVHVDANSPISLVSNECVEKFFETGDVRYMASDIRLVVRTNKKTQETDGFIMIVYPELSYMGKNLDHPLRDITYLKRNKSFIGFIYYHDLNGEFVNGCRYNQGVAYRLEPRTSILRNYEDDYCTLYFQYIMDWQDFYTMLIGYGEYGDPQYNYSKLEYYTS